MRPSREHQLADLGRKVVLGSAIAVLIAFFLPWVKQTGFISGNNTGYTLAETSQSKASGNDLRVLFLVPTAAAISLIFLIPVVRRPLGTPIVQIAVAAIGLLVLATTLPDELATWVGIEHSYSYGLWITVVALVGIAVGGVLQILSRRLNRPGEGAGSSLESARQ